VSPPQVIFPDWSRGEHYQGVVVHCSLTRNKERVYDVEYRDTGVYDRINGVRGEYIQVLDDSSVHTVAAVHGSRAGAVLKEGIRVHVRAADKKARGGSLFFPGRIAAVHRSGTIDVECGERVLNGLTPNDVVLGLENGYSVMARQPTRMQLQCTGASWTCSGGALAASYGRNDITGWCDYPGAVCVWSIFDKSFQASEPQHVFDHPSCIMCVACHPLSPSIVAGGSFNGEVVIWNLNEPEKAVAMTAIDSPYSHKEPVLDVKWVYDNALKKHLLASAGADGKLLFWDMDSGLKTPVRGVVISKSREKRNHYPMSHGGTSVAFTSTPASHRVEWVLVGQEGGGIARGQMSRVDKMPRIADGQAAPVSDDIYPAMRRGEDSFAYEAHVGPVMSVDGSPFHRYLFLSGGNDGVVRLYHVLERKPLFEWEPSPPPGTPGLTGKLFGAVTAVQFSPVCPVVFAAASSEGFIFFFNLAVSTTGPISWVQAPAPAAAAAGGGGKRRAQASSARAGITGIAFNLRQRDMFAASDSNGGVHVWKLDWALCAAGGADQGVLDRLGSTQIDAAANAN
jgi:WD40 repeat protein